MAMLLAARRLDALGLSRRAPRVVVRTGVTRNVRLMVAMMGIVALIAGLA
jgi:hypothetical protein